ncbi:MAG: hypothetical protein ACYDAR_18875, partial [Thermomicrobiales bacterium]
LPLATTGHADGPAIAGASLPIGPGALTNPRISGSLVVWQETNGAFGVDLSTGQPLPIPGSGTSEPDVAGSFVVWKQGASSISGFDTATGAQFSVPVGDAKVAGPSVSEAGVVAWLAQDSNGIAVKVWDRATGTTAEAGRIPTNRLPLETLGLPRVSGRRVVFPDLTADPARLSRMILFDMDAAQWLPVNDAFGGRTAMFGFARNRLALAQGARIAVLDFATNAIEAIPANLGPGQQVSGVGFDGATVVWSTSPDAGGTTAIYGYDLARHLGYPIAQGQDANIAPAVSGPVVVWSHAGGLAARTVTFADPTPPITVRQDLRYFPETGYVVGYAFLTFWNANGGATIFGFPLTNEGVDPASQLTVQYFERSRFEYHPEAAGTPQLVQLTNVGRIITAGRTDPAFPPQPLVPAGSDRSYYVQTQHSIGGQFKKFFDQNGGIFIFGYPISEETIEPNPTDGVAYTVQWFERARFEFHPEFNATPNAIELGQLGRQLLLGQLGLYKPQCSPLYIQKPLLPECR